MSQNTLNRYKTILIKNVIAKNGFKQKNQKTNQVNQIQKNLAEIMTTSIKANREQVKQHLKNSEVGAIIIGLPGIGKTTLVRTPRMVSASILAMEFQAQGLDAIKRLINSQLTTQKNKIIIDDLGLEEDVKHYGNGLDPIAYVIQRIYDINQSNPDNQIKLFLTTNLGKKELTEKYGIRVVERIWEMCDRIKLEDTNLRNANKNLDT